MHKDTNADVVGRLDIAEWKRISVRSRWSKVSNPWEDLPSAPLTIAQARDLHANGLVWKALQYDGDDVFVVVKRRHPIAA